MLHDIRVFHKEPILLYCDNKIALHIAPNPVFHERDRHIEMDSHYIRDKIQEGAMETRVVKSAGNQLAVVLTKSLGKDMFIPMILEFKIFTLQLEGEC